MEIFGREVGERDWILEILRSRCYLSINNIGKFVRVGIRCRDDFLTKLVLVSFQSMFCCCIFSLVLCMSPWPNWAFV